MPKVTNAHLAARREQILSAALTCFSRQGFHRTTMQDICREANLSAGAVYRYFPGKDDIIEAICAEAYGRNQGLIRAAEERGETLEVLFGLADAFFGLLAEPSQREGCRIDMELWAEALRNDRVYSIAAERFNGTLYVISQIVRRAQANGDINPSLDSEAVGRFMIALYQGAELQKALEPGVDVRKIAAVAKALVSGSFWTGARQDIEDP